MTCPEEGTPGPEVVPAAPPEVTTAGEVTEGREFTLGGEIDAAPDREREAGKLAEVETVMELEFEPVVEPVTEFVTEFELEFELETVMDIEGEFEGFEQYLKTLLLR